MIFYLVKIEQMAKKLRNFGSICVFEQFMNRKIFLIRIMIMKSQQVMSDSDNKSYNVQNGIIIGYYNLRGKAQVCRLLCQYLGVAYKDQLFTLAQWDKYKNGKSKGWSFTDLPFMKEGEFVVTQAVPICLYIINRFGSPELLGKTVQDQALVDMYLWNIDAMSNVISINCQQKSREELEGLKANQWQLIVYPRLFKIEDKARQNNWYMGYLTIIDFSIYELFTYMENIFPGKTTCFPKLESISKRVAELDSIKDYESSPRAIKEWCPTKLLAQLQKKSQQGAPNGSNSTIEKNKIQNQIQTNKQIKSTIK